MYRIRFGKPSESRVAFVKNMEAAKNIYVKLFSAAFCPAEDSRNSEKTSLNVSRLSDRRAKREATISIARDAEKCFTRDTSPHINSHARAFRFHSYRAIRMPSLQKSRNSLRSASSRPVNSSGKSLKNGAQTRQLFRYFEPPQVATSIFICYSAAISTV